MLYCLAVLATRYGIVVHAYYVASNHHHMIVTDTRGEYPEFLRDLHSLTARAMNQHRGRSENLWAGSVQTSVVHLLDPTAVMQELVYTLTNAVKDRLVAKVSDWPGVCSYNAMLHDKTLRIERPKRFFRKNGKLPDVAEIRFERPEAFAELSHDEWAAEVRDEVQRIERSHAQDGSAIVGRKEVLATSPIAQPASEAPSHQLNPTVASRDPKERAAQLERNKHFQQQYRAALAAYRDGDKAVVFPFGTYQLVRDRHVSCDSRPPPSI